MNINEFVKNFINSLSLRNTQVVIDRWEDEDLQERLQALFPKKNRSPRKKTKKDKDAPKRGKSGYIFFCMQARSDIKTNNPTMGATDITREMGRVWNSMTDEDKAPFLAEAVGDKERYELEMVNYVPSLPCSDEDEPNAKKAKKTSPKRGKSAYNFFCSEERQKIKDENEEMNNSEILSELARRWAVLKENDEGEFSRYKELAAEDKTRVLVENDEDEERVVVVKPVKVKKARNPYIFFCQANRAVAKENNPDTDAKQITAILAKMWNDLKLTGDIEEYKKMAEKDKERFKEEQEEVKEVEEDVEEVEEDVEEVEQVEEEVEQVEQVEEEVEVEQVEEEVEVEQVEEEQVEEEVVKPKKKSSKKSTTVKKTKTSKKTKEGVEEEEVVKPKKKSSKNTKE